MRAEFGSVASYDEAMALIQRQCGEKCVRVLDDCGVFKDDEPGRKGFLKFVRTLGYTCI